MPITTLSGREFSQDASKAKRAAKDGPVVITDRGRPSHVLLTYEDYRRLSGSGISLLEALAADDDIDFEPVRLGDEIFRPVDFDE
jgi:prevent-host-death family protein